MKKLCLAMLAALFLFCGCAGEEAAAEYFEMFGHEDLRDKELTVENEYLSLRLDCETTQISVTDKRTGKVWTSNPANAADDAVAVKAGKEKLASQLLLNYGQESGVVTEINNNTLSLMNGSFSWEQLDGGIKVSYTLGKMDEVFFVPEAVPETRFRMFYDQLETSEQKALDNYYRVVDLNNLRSTEDPDELLQQYPQLADERMYLLREGLQKNILNRLVGYFDSIGYTAEDYATDKAAAAEGEETETPIFNVSVVYSLDGPDFTVSVPLDEIEYRYNFPVLSVAVLPYFGSGGTEDEGFMMVPDASGAVINFNNGKQNQQPYINSAYGYDYAVKRTALVADNAAAFPVFGISNNGSSFICVVEDGAENASFEADVSGRVNSYNYANSRYTVLKWDDVDISKANVYAKVTERKELTGAFSQRYIFTESDGYTGMATTYRDYLLKKYPELKKDEETDLPAVLGLIGAIDRGTNIAGFPVIQAYPLTTYSEAAGIIKDYKDAGVKNLRVGYSGWFNGGVAHDAPDDISLIGKLGNKNDFKALLNAADESDTPVFMEADFTFVSDQGMFNGYGVNRDSAKRLSRDVAELYPYSYVWFGEIDFGPYSNRYGYYLANPAYTMKAIDSFYKDLTALGGKNIVFGSIGRTVNSDFNVKRPVTTKEAAAMQQSKMGELNGDGARLMIHGGFDYAAPYADFIIDMELESKNYNIIDESIPFYQMVLHGLVPYSGSPINLAADYDRAVLKTVETGAGLQFQFMAAAGEELQDTNYSRYFASDIARWGGKPAELYNRLNGELGHTSGLLMTGHEKLAGNVYMTEYEDGTKVMVNYGTEPFEHEGTEVGAKDFAVLRQ